MRKSNGESERKNRIVRNKTHIRVEKLAHTHTLELSEGVKVK